MKWYKNLDRLKLKEEDRIFTKFWQGKTAFNLLKNYKEAKSLYAPLARLKSTSNFIPKAQFMLGSCDYESAKLNKDLDSYKSAAENFDKFLS